MTYGVTCKTYRCVNADCVRHKKRYRADYERALERGHQFMVDGAPSRRKIGSLRMLGWSLGEIAKHMGLTHQSLARTIKREQIRATTAKRIDEAYRHFEMKIPAPSRYVSLVKNQARAEGHKVPLAWEDIDAGVLAKVGKNSVPHDRFDLEEIDYVMQYHDFTVRLSPPEKVEIFRRWVADGRSKASLERLSGWKSDRYQEAS